MSRNQDEVTEKIVVDDASLAKMSGDDVDVEPFLVSLNTLGNDEPQLKFSQPNASIFVGVCSGQVVVGFSVSNGFAEVRWWRCKWVGGGVGGGGQKLQKM